MVEQEKSERGRKKSLKMCIEFGGEKSELEQLGRMSTFKRRRKNHFLGVIPEKCGDFCNWIKYSNHRAEGRLV